MIRLHPRVEGGGTPPPREPTRETTETPRSPESPPPPRAEGTPETRRTEERHSGASTVLSGAGRDLTAVTGTTGTVAPASDVRARFDRELERFEGLRRTSPEEARRMLPSLRALASQLLEHLPSQSREFLDLLRTVRGFYRHARDLSEGAEAETFRRELALTGEHLGTVRNY